MATPIIKTDDDFFFNTAALTKLDFYCYFCFRREIFLSDINNIEYASAFVNCSKVISSNRPSDSGEIIRIRNSWYYVVFVFFGVVFRCYFTYVMATLYIYVRQASLCVFDDKGVVSIVNISPCLNKFPFKSEILVDDKN